MYILSGVGNPRHLHSGRASRKQQERREPDPTPPSIVSFISELFRGKSKQAANCIPPPRPEDSALQARFEPLVVRYLGRDTPADWLRRRSVLGTRSSDAHKSDGVQIDAVKEVVFRAHHRALLRPLDLSQDQGPLQLDYVGDKKMRNHVQILTTPTADTPSTTLILHFDNKRYLIGNIGEGTQRACVQMGARLLKVSECFITGRTEWQNVGGLMGMILTLADAATSSSAANKDEVRKRVLAKAKRDGVTDGSPEMEALLEEVKRETSTKLKLFGPPNLNYLLATARRFVFRKGMPLDVHEVEESSAKGPSDEKWSPYWADENVKVWAMSISPTPSTGVKGTVSPRKRSFEEMHTDSTKGPLLANDLTQEERNKLTVKAVVSEMFDSSWRLDTLHETRLSDVRMPATVFIRDPSTNKIKKYQGPMPGGQQPVPDPHMTVLVRQPWPGALIDSLPAMQPAKEAISYIIRNQRQRGRFYPDRAVKLNVSKGFKWSQLASGSSVQNEDGETITPDMVLGEDKEGGGFAIVDLPEPSYIDALLVRPEWKEPAVMAGVGAIVWICGRGVASDQRVHAFMREHSHLQHVVSSPEYCPNNIALDSVAAATVRLKQVDPSRYTVPVHQSGVAEDLPRLPENARPAVRGQAVQLEPAVEVQNRDVVPHFDIASTEAETAQEVLLEAAKAQMAVKSAKEDIRKWTDTLPTGMEDAEVITLGTGSALPSKYRNVSATLLRVPGWGSMLLDCGENTLGQLKRVFEPAELKLIFSQLRIIFISHMHADHHLGTIAVIKAWYEEVHKGVPLGPEINARDNFESSTGLAVVSEPAMHRFLSEYAAIEDFGLSRVAPLHVSAATPSRGFASTLGWFVSPLALAKMSKEAHTACMNRMRVQPSFLNLRDIQSVAVHHCHGSRAVSITFPPAPGSNTLPFKVSYSGDCRPSHPFSVIGKDSTVCIHEATFDDELQGDAEAKNHSTTSEALTVAQAMGSRACVLTHFSQRYQKVPVLERDEDGASAPKFEAAADDGADPEDTLDGPLEDAASVPVQQTDGGNGQSYDLPTNGNSGSTAAIKFKLASDMKVCVAFDYMRVKVGDIAQMEKFTPALLKLFEDGDAEKAGSKDEKGKAEAKTKSNKQVKEQRR